MAPWTANEVLGAARCNEPATSQKASHGMAMLQTKSGARRPRFLLRKVADRDRHSVRQGAVVNQQGRACGRKRTWTAGKIRCMHRNGASKSWLLVAGLSPPVISILRRRDVGASAAAANQTLQPLERYRTESPLAERLSAPWSTGHSRMSDFLPRHVYVRPAHDMQDGRFVQQGSTVVDGVSPAMQGRDTVFSCNTTCFEKMIVGELQVRVCRLVKRRDGRCGAESPRLTSMAIVPDRLDSVLATSGGRTRLRSKNGALLQCCSPLPRSHSSQGERNGTAACQASRTEESRTCDLRLWTFFLRFVGCGYFEVRAWHFASVPRLFCPALSNYLRQSQNVRPEGGTG